MSKGILIINLGTPDAANKKAVRRYLAEFLADPRVIDLPAVIRYTLLYAIILPFRTPKACKAYESIWTEHGSPLRYHGEQLESKLQSKLGAEYTVALGMRYGNPSIARAVDRLKHCASITIIPLFPQYASAASGSAIEAAMRCISKLEIIPNLHLIRDFYSDLDFINAQVSLVQKYAGDYEHLLFSYHGLPERQLQKIGCAKICDKCPSPDNARVAPGCYRAQCTQTTALIAEKLQLKPEHYSQSFQSRLGKTPWIKPYTDETMQQLAAKGIKKLAVVCPSFIADCLETLEEIAMAAKEDWEKMTGGELHVVPCLNSDPDLVAMLAKFSHGN